MTRQSPPEGPGRSEAAGRSEGTGRPDGAGYVLDHSPRELDRLDSPWHGYIEESVRSMLPLERRLGVVGFEEAEIDTLGERLRRETVVAEGVVMGWPVVTPWSRLP